MSEYQCMSHLNDQTVTRVSMSDSISRFFILLNPDHDQNQNHNQNVIRVDGTAFIRLH